VIAPDDALASATNFTTFFWTQAGFERHGSITATARSSCIEQRIDPLLRAMVGPVFFRNEVAIDIEGAESLTTTPSQSRPGC
jgi:hypothetical protein